MKQGQDITAHFPGILIIHQKIRGNAVGFHQHDEHEFFFPLQGEIQIQAGEGLLKAGPGKMLYLPPGLEHSFTAAAHSQGERLILIVEDSTWKLGDGGKIAPSVASASQLCKELLFHLLLHPKTKAAKSLISTLIQTLSEMFEPSGVDVFGSLSHLDGRTEDSRIKRAIKLIQEKSNQPLSMAELAKNSGVSTRNLNRLFLAELEMTPKQVITLFRIESAKKLLKAGRMSVTDVTFEVGYNSVSQFISTFRKLTGQLPSEYR